MISLVRAPTHFADWTRLQNGCSFQTPSRRARVSSIASVGGEDKENTRSFVGGKRGEGSSNGGGDSFGKIAEVDTQLSGQKRGGGDIAIEKQKSFTGSYFQVRSCPSSREVRFAQTVFFAMRVLL